MKFSKLALSLVAALSFSALAQNLAVVNGKPIPKAREDAWVKELTKQGQADSPDLRKMVKERLIQNEVLLQEATKRGIADKADVKFMLDVQRQNTLIQALLRDEVTLRDAAGDFLTQTHLGAIFPVVAHDEAGLQLLVPVRDENG
ncbi:MAG: hypothetical protein RIS02_1981, partial [Pseudomonadota bacterium]